MQAVFPLDARLGPEEGLEQIKLAREQALGGRGSVVVRWRALLLDELCYKVVQARGGVGLEKLLLFF